MILQIKKLLGYKVKTFESQYDKDKQILTLDFSDGSKEQYFGSCTVWYEMPSMKRCSTPKESYLLELWKKGTL